MQESEPVPNRYAETELAAMRLLLGRGESIAAIVDSFIAAGSSRNEDALERKIRRVRAEYIPNTTDLPPGASVVLMFTDPHIPAHHPDALDFVASLRDKHDPTHIICGGDLVDFHAANYHEHDPDLPGLQGEVALIREHLAPWFDAFPQVRWCAGNHDRLPARQGASAGLTADMMRPLPEFLGCPVGWEYRDEFVIDGVLYEHGDQRPGGMSAPRRAALETGMSFCMGHLHTSGGIQIIPSGRSGYGDRFAANAGCLINKSDRQFRYTKNRPTLGAVIVEGGRYPTFAPMTRNWRSVPDGLPYYKRTAGERL